MVPEAPVAPQGRVGTRVDREEQPLAGESLVERDAPNTGLHNNEQIVRSHFEDRIHLRQVDRDAALDRQHVPLEG